MEDDPGGEPPRISLRNAFILGWRSAFIAGVGLFCYFALFAAPGVQGEMAGGPETHVAWFTILTPKVCLLVLVLAVMSGFFSASEIAFLSLNKVEVHAMRISDSWLLHLIAHVLRRPGSLLTTILMGNTIVNAVLSIALAKPLADVFTHAFQFSTARSYALSVVITTSLLVFFCEMLPKVFAAIRPRTFAVGAVIPLYLTDRLLAPLRRVVMLAVGFFFKITRLSQVTPAPFLTDEEFITLLSEGEASGLIEEEERQMIKGILEFGDVTLDEILVPRLDIVGVKESASVREAVETFREHEYSRMPVYEEDLDHVTGVLYAKDLLPAIEADELDRPVNSYMRKPHFVPATMSVGDFVKMAQRLRIHIAIAVDEYGGTEGLITLQDALREVVGNIGEEDDEDEPLFTTISEGVWQLAGNYPLDEFEQNTGISSGDEEHTTVGGFLMALSDKILEPGDELEYSGLHFSIKEVDKKRVIRVLVRDLRQGGHQEETGS